MGGVTISVIIIIIISYGSVGARDKVLEQIHISYGRDSEGVSGGGEVSRDCCQCKTNIMRAHCQTDREE